MKFLIMMAALALSMQAQSATMYKCSENNVVSYQYHPCTGSAKQVIIEDKPPTEGEANAGGTLEDDLLLGEFSLKKDHQDSSGDQWFVYKVLVSNRSNDERKVRLHYKAVDYQGFLITEVYLTGTVKPLSSETLTDKNYVDNGKFARIHKWVLDK
jgi:ABC-type uncharacterized transport system permease subunit